MIEADVYKNQKYKGNKKPLVSIGLPVYNGEKLISQAIEALLAQTFEDFELIISDNASTDRTGEICKSYAAQDKRIIYQCNDCNIGAVANFDKVAYMATGCFFMWTAHDDLCESAFINALIKPLLESSSVVLAYPKVLTIAPDGEDCWDEHDEIETVGMKSPSDRVRKVHKGVVRRQAIYGLMRRDAVMKVLPMPSVRGLDHAFLTLLAIEGEFVYVPKRLFTYRLQEIERWRWKERYLRRQMILEPNAARPKKYGTYRPAVKVILRRVLKTDLRPTYKIRIYFDTFLWGIRIEMERIRPFTQLWRWQRKISELLAVVIHKNDDGERTNG